MKHFGVAIYGAGVVGGGVIDILRRQAPVLASRGLQFDIRTIVCRDSKRKRDFDVPATARVTTDALQPLTDPGIDMIVEVMGGTTLAAQVLLDAAQRGKHVVTANKALLAEQLPAVEASFSASNGRLGFEAAVAGGIPVIRTMQQALATDNFHAVQGILNGTTNYMLSSMDRAGVSYAAALKEAQDAGFAEADPTADVEGHDARNKLVLLARLAFGVTVPPSRIHTVGLPCVTADDFAFARLHQRTLKLVCRAALVGGTRLETWVSPAFVPRASLLGGTDGALNAVESLSEFLGPFSMQGPGAGRYPTANSIVADMVNIALDEQARLPFPRPPAAAGSGPTHSSEVTAQFCIRAAVVDQPPSASSSLGALRGALQSHRIDCEVLTGRDASGGGAASRVLTGVTTLRAVHAALAAVRPPAASASSSTAHPRQFLALPYLL